MTDFSNPRPGFAVYSEQAMPTMKTSAIAELKLIPGVGPSIASDLYSLGVGGVGDLRGRNPECLYARLCEQHGHTVDRCVLYVFRCAVYYASTERHRPELLKWWNWKDHSNGLMADSAS